MSVGAYLLLAGVAILLKNKLQQPLTCGVSVDLYYRGLSKLQSEYLIYDQIYHWIFLIVPV